MFAGTKAQAPQPVLTFLVGSAYPAENPCEGVGVSALLRTWRPQALRRMRSGRHPCACRHGCCPARLAPLAGRRVGVFWRWFEDADAEVVAACRHALRLMEERGCEVRLSRG